MQTYVNPISGGKDPYVMKGPDGHYYSVYSGGNRGCSIYVSESLKISEPGVSHLVWTAADGRWNSGTVWAPEIHYLQGKYYIYYTSAVMDYDIEGWATRRLGVLEAENPLGPYVDRGRLELGEEMSIDGTVLQMPDGRLYFVYMRNLMFRDRMNCLCIAQMESPTKIMGEPVMISHPCFPWEEFVNEGPETLIRNGKVMILYSAHAAHTPEYCLAILECLDTKDPLREQAWKKQTSPVFKKGNGVIGPGHASVTVSADGKVPYLIYHSKSNESSVFHSPGVMDRVVSVQPFKWGENDLPVFGEPVGFGKPMPLPNGETEDMPGKRLDSVIRTDNDCLIAYGYKEYLNIVEDTLYLEGKDKLDYGCKAMIRGFSWTDFSASVDMRMPSGEGAGLLLRVKNAGARRFMLQGYAVLLSPRFGLEILRLDGGEPVRLKYTPLGMICGDWVTLKVTAEKNRITARVNETTVSVEDGEYMNGRIGLTADGTLGWFKNMRVEASGK